MEADRKAQQAVADAECGAILRLQTLVRRRRRMGDEALGVAEIVGDVDKAKRVHHAKRARLSAGDLEGHQRAAALHLALRQRRLRVRSEEHTSELQSLMRISYAVFCLKK